jgi:hypothetical protein
MGVGQEDEASGPLRPDEGIAFKAAGQDRVSLLPFILLGEVGSPVLEWTTPFRLS